MSGRRTTVIGVILVSLAIIAATSYAIWYERVRPLTLREVYEREHWKVGDVRDVAGKITNISRVNTSYGPMVMLGLDWPDSLSLGVDVFGDPSLDYHVGDYFKRTLHFTDLSVNGVSGIWAPEMAGPFPLIPLAVDEVSDAVSRAMGVSLALKDTNENGWSTYEVLTVNQEKYPLHMVNASLLKAGPVDIPYSLDSAAAWVVWAAVEFVRTSGFYMTDPEVDAIESFSTGVSRNGTMEFVDGNSDGFLDDGDLLRIHLDWTESATEYESYFLRIGRDSWHDGYASGVKAILNRERGPFHLLIQEETRWLGFGNLSFQGSDPVTSNLDVTSVRQGAPSELNGYQVKVYAGQYHGPIISVNLKDTPVTQQGKTLDFRDSNANGLLDAGDRFIVGGFANHTLVHISVEQTVSEGSYGWIAGYGHVVGNMPYFSMISNSTHAPARINVTVPFWHQEMEVKGTQSVSLRENGVQVITNATLKEGEVGSFAGGNVTFIDADHDGFISTGDYFLLTGDPSAHYELEVSVLWGHWRMKVEI